MNNRIRLCLAAALLAPGGYALAADTCASPTDLNAAGASFSLPNNTCNGSAQATLLCGNFDYSQKKEIIYSFTLGAGFTATSFTLTGVSGGFTPAMFVTSSACAAADTCDANGTTSIDLTTLTTGVPYFLIVTTTPAAAAANCGPYTLNSNGTLPVKLKDFSVQ